MKKLKSGDPIMVIAGKYKGKISSIEKIDENKVWVK
jgi:ribosomal protein L24